MDHRQPSKRAPVKGFNAHHRSDHRRPREAQSPTSEIVTRLRRAPGEIPKESLAKPAVSGGDDYVRRWLAQTDSGINSDIKSPNRAQEREPEHRDGIQKPQVDLRSFCHAAPDPVIPPNGKRRRHSSSDSSLLETALRWKLQAPFRRDVNPDTRKRREESSPYIYKRRKAVESDSGISAQLSSHPVNFQKRARHKTRVDRYEPKEKRRPDKADASKRSTKPRNRKKSANKASKDLMANFSSKALGQDRLTIRPSHGTGIFNNGRASSPARHRGLPDLAFSEMEFLQHSTRFPSAKRDDKIISKSRAKEKLKASRAQGEIHTFFNQLQTPLVETSVNTRRRRTSKSTSDGLPMYLKQGAADQAHGQFQFIDFPKISYFRFSQSTPLSNRLSDSSAHTPHINDLRTADTNRRLSESTTTCVTWSETQVSPDAALEQLSIGGRYRASPTPDWVRRSIERTGIFRDTGIGIAPDLRPSRPEQPCRQDNLYARKSLRDSRGNLIDSNGITDTAVSEECASEISKATIVGPRSKSRDRTTSASHDNHRTDKEDFIEKLAERRPGEYLCVIGGCCAAKRPHNTTTTADHDGESEWQHQNPSIQESTLPTASLGAEVLKESKSALITREQIARNARIKRPATTLQATKVTREENREITDHVGLHHSIALSEETTTNSGLVPATPAEEKIYSTTGGQHAPEGEPLSQGRARERPPDVQALPGIQQNLEGISYEQTPKEFDSSTHERAIALSTEKSLESEAGRERCILMSLSDITKLNSEGLENNSLAGLPERGSWLPQLEQVAQGPRLQPMTGMPSLYLHQIQRQYIVEEEHLLYDLEFGNDKTAEQIGDLNPQAVQSMHDIEYNMMEEDGHGYPSDRFSENLSLQEIEELGICEDHGSNPQQWQQVGQEVTGQARMWNVPREIQDAYSGYNFAQSYGMGKENNFYEEQEVEPFPLHGFWRPHGHC